MPYQVVRREKTGLGYTTTIQDITVDKSEAISLANLLNTLEETGVTLDEDGMTYTDDHDKLPIHLNEFDLIIGNHYYFILETEEIEPEFLRESIKNIKESIEYLIKYPVFIVNSLHFPKDVIHLHLTCSGRQSPNINKAKICFKELQRYLDQGGIKYQVFTEYDGINACSLNILMKDIPVLESYLRIRKGG